MTTAAGRLDHLKGHNAMKRPTSDIAFTPAVKAAQVKTDSRKSYAKMEQRGGWQDRKHLRQTLQIAKRLLRANQINGTTRPSGHLYPHQWNWDAGFIARGYLWFDPEQAYREIRLLFEGQWTDGFLPHIVFNPSARNHFPGPDYWKADRSGRAPNGISTSGISQPAVHASMLVAALDLDPDRDRNRGFLKEMYPKFKALHDFFFRFRDPLNEGLVCLVHPWESGLDNSPLWDEPLSRITRTSPWAKRMQRQYDELVETGDRPSRDYIEKYSYLVENLSRHEYDWKRVLESHPFLIQDVLFNTLLCQSERDLGKIAESIGENPEPHYQRATGMSQAINGKLWDKSQRVYRSYDLFADEPIQQQTVFSYIPLYAGVCDESRAEQLIDNLMTHCFCLAEKNCAGVPSYDMCQADYDGECYWRGPVWFNINWYLAKGLRKYGHHEDAEWIENTLLELPIRHGFHEYYEPQTGKGLGASRFSWTAALFIDLAVQHLSRNRTFDKSRR